MSSDPGLAAGGEQAMEYRRCGRSGLRLSALTLGGWQTVGGYEAAGVARAVFLRAFDLGITSFDFANDYGRAPGDGEREGGRILAELPRHEIVVATKAGFRMWPGPYGDGGSRKYLLTSCEQSLRRLGLDHVDLFYSHRFDPETPLEETLGALATLVQQGKALYVGISNYDARQTRRAVDLWREMGGGPLIVHQARYNLLDRAIEDDLLPALRLARLGLAVFSPLAQGLLTERALAGVPAGRWAETGMRWRPAAPDADTLARVRRLAEIARRRGQSLAQMALAWCLRLPEVTTVVTAVSSLAQLEASAGALVGPPFTAEELSAIDACGWREPV